MLTTSREIRVLGRADLADFLRLTARDPAGNVFVEHRARTTMLEPRWLGGEVWGRFDADSQLRAACHVGANLVPVECDPDDAVAFAARAVPRPARVSTIVGRHEAVEVFWQAVSPLWERPREERWRQPHLVLAADPEVAPDPAVRRSLRADFAALYPACVAMYEEEIGVSPEAGGTRDLYKARVLQLITKGWSFARYEDRRVVFKAEVACLTPEAAQIQGVWVAPERRGEGLATHGLAAVIRAVRRDLAPMVSLYVNDFNAPARKVYERLGFTQSAEFATLMF